MYPYPNYSSSENESRQYSKEISRVFGFLSIIFAIFLPPTGMIMGIFGLIYEKRDAEKTNSGYSYLNLGLNAAGMAIGTLYLTYLVLFKWKII